MSKPHLVFLGGTVGGNKWRDGFIRDLKERGVDPDTLFNPVVADWNAAAQEAEEKAKANASHFIFYIADPQQEGNTTSFYSGIEATMALYDAPKTTVVVFDMNGMNGHALKGMTQSMKVLKRRFPDANILGGRDEALQWLCNQFGVKY
jgi:hypothetical protein